jgi:hypothetical protein
MFHAEQRGLRRFTCQLSPSNASLCDGTANPKVKMFHVKQFDHRNQGLSRLPTK